MSPKKGTQSAPPRPADVGREEVTTTRFERFLAFVLAIFLLIGLLWLYAEPLDRTDDIRYEDSYSSYYVDEPYAPPVPSKATAGDTVSPPAAETGPVGDPRDGDEALVKQLRDAGNALGLSDAQVTTRTEEVALAREAYRTRLDAGEPAEAFKTTFLAAEKALADAEAELKDAQAAYDKVKVVGEQAQQRLSKAADDLRDKRERETFLLRLALAVASLGLSVLMLHQLHRRRARFTLLGMSAVGAATALALVMTGDYLDVEEVGPIVLSVAGTAATLAAFIAYQRWLARRLPERRVRKGECPFCGYPVRDGTHCQGCGRAAVGACTTCEQPRRVGARHCASCGAG